MNHREDSPTGLTLEQHPEHQAAAPERKPKSKRPGCICDCGNCPCGPNAAQHADAKASTEDAALN